MQPELDEKRFGMLPLSKIEAFYRAYHGYLKNNGVDGVKVGRSYMCAFCLFDALCYFIATVMCALLLSTVHPICFAVPAQPVR